MEEFLRTAPPHTIGVYDKVKISGSYNSKGLKSDGRKAGKR